LHHPYVVEHSVLLQTQQFIVWFDSVRVIHVIHGLDFIAFVLLFFGTGRLILTRRGEDLGVPLFHLEDVVDWQARPQSVAELRERALPLFELGLG